MIKLTTVAENNILSLSPLSDHSRNPNVMHQCLWLNVCFTCLTFVKCVEIKVYSDILYTLVQHEEGICSQREKLFSHLRVAGSVGHRYNTFVKCGCFSSTSVFAETTASSRITTWWQLLGGKVMYFSFRTHFIFIYRFRPSSVFCSFFYSTGWAVKNDERVVLFKLLLFKLVITRKSKLLIYHKILYLGFSWVLG